MQNQRQGLHSTKVLPHQQTKIISESKLHPEEKRHGFYLNMYDPKEKIYTDQAGISCTDRGREINIK